MTFAGTESHHSSWQCMESHHCCCHRPFAPLAMGDSRTSTVLTRYESMRLRSFRQSERTTLKDPVQHKRWTYLRFRAVNTEHQQRWTCWWCTKPSKHLKKGDKYGRRLYWRYINVVPLWIKPCDCKEFQMHWWCMTPSKHWQKVINKGGDYIEGT